MIIVAVEPESYMITTIQASIHGTGLAVFPKGLQFGGSETFASKAAAIKRLFKYFCVHA